MCTCEILSTKGWEHYVGSQRGLSTAVVGEREVHYDDINGVLIRRPCIFEQELIHVSSADRTYVGAEMNAFLISWLSSMTCPVINRLQRCPYLGQIGGLNSGVHTVALLGIPVSPIKKSCSLTENERSVTTATCFHKEVEKVTVVEKNISVTWKKLLETRPQNLLTYLEQSYWRFSLAVPRMVHAF